MNARSAEGRRPLPHQFRQRVRPDQARILDGRTTILDHLDLAMQLDPGPELRVECVAANHVPAVGQRCFDRHVAVIDTEDDLCFNFEEQDGTETYGSRQEQVLWNRAGGDPMEFGRSADHGAVGHPGNLTGCVWGADTETDDDRQIR